MLSHFLYSMLLCPHVNYPGFSGQKTPFYRADTAQIQHGYSTQKRLKYKRAAPIMEWLFFFLCSYATMLCFSTSQPRVTLQRLHTRSNSSIRHLLGWTSGHRCLQRHSYRSAIPEQSFDCSMGSYLIVAYKLMCMPDKCEFSP